MELTGLRYWRTVNRLDWLVCMLKLVEMYDAVVDLLGELAWKLN